MSDELTQKKASDEKFCHECGATINAKAEICPKCGVRQTAAPVIQADKTKTAAALFAFFLGGFGAHKFYLGQTGLGFLYLLLFWTLIPAFIAFVEFIIFLTMSDDAFNKKYCQIAEAEV